MAALTACQPAMTFVSARMPEESVARVSLADTPLVDAPIDRPIVIQADNGRLVDVTVTEGPSRVIKGGALR